MRKLLSKLMMLVMSVFGVCFVSCSNDEANNETPNPATSNEAKVYFVYTLDTSIGDMMTRGAKTNAEVFDEFYEKIKTGDLVAPSFELTLTEVNSDVMYTFKGKWNSHDLLTLRTGSYRVVGKSTADGDNIQEKCSFTFDEQIDISITSNIITLHAKYDSSLLIFNNEKIQTLQNFNGSALASFFTFSTYKYAFVNNTLYDEAKKNDAYILGRYTDDAEFKIFTGNLYFEKGKYYVYNSISNGFDVPPMEEGNEPNREVADAIDLGLSVKWASWNVGADKPEGLGNLYAWGELSPKTDYSTSTYKLYSNGYTKYGSVDNKYQLDSEDDVAQQTWGDKWRIPTIEELKELKEKCTFTKTELNGVPVTKVTGPNGNFIYFPYPGNFTGTTLYYENSIGSYWSCDLDYDSYAKDLDFRSGMPSLNGDYRYHGQSIRPIYVGASR